MAIILDADLLIRGEKGTFDLADWLASQPEEEFEVAAIRVGGTVARRGARHLRPSNTSELFSGASARPA